MSGNGKGNNRGGNNKSGGSGGYANPPPQPTIVSGYRYHQYAQSQPDRYVYIGKDEDTREPEFLDYGPKSARR